MALAAAVYTALLTWAAIAFRRPERWLALFTWLLPLHVLAIAFLFGFLQLPAATVRLIAAWKETAVLLALLTVGVRAAAGHGERLTPVASDAAVGAFCFLPLVYLTAENALLHADLDLVPQLYGARDAGFFAVLYFVGRLTPEVADDRTLRRLFHVGIATSVAAVLERLFVAPEFLVLIGAKTYYQEFLGVEEFTQGNEYGLVDNYWTLIGGHLVPRAGSVYLNSMNFAIAFVLVIPAATLWLLSRQDRRPMRSWLGYAVAWAGLLLTITRMSIVTAALEVLLIAVVLKRPGLLTGLAATGTAAFAAGLVLVPNMAGFVWETLTWQTGSSTAHLDTWSRGLNTLATHPLGMGLATADAGIRFGLTPVSADNLYLKYGAEQGVLGLASLVAMLATIGWTAWKLSQSDAPPAQQRFGVFVLVATLGIAVNGLTITILTTQMLSYLFFWAAGSTVTLAQRTSPSRVG